MPNTDFSLKKRAFSGIFWKFAERLCAQGVSLLVSILLARILLPEDYAVISIVTIFFAFCNVLITGGLNTSLIQKKDADALDYSTVLYVSLAVAGVLYAVMFFAAPAIAALYQNSLLVPIIRVMALTFFINAVKSVLTAYTSSRLQFRKFFFSTIIGTVISAVVGVWMALAGFGAWALVAQQMSNSFIDTVVLFCSTRLNIKFAFSWKRLKGLFSYGWKIFAASLITIAYDQIRPLVVGIKFSAADLAYYNKGQSFPDLINTTLCSTLESVLFPVLSKAQDSKQAVLAMTRRYMKTASFLIFPLLSVFFLAAESFTAVILTDKWLPIVPYIRIFCISSMFQIIQTGNLQAIKAIGRSDVTLILEIIKKSAYLLIVAWFIAFARTPQALAFSGVLCTLIASAVNTFPNRKLIGYSYRAQLSDLLPNFLLSLGMGAITAPISLLPIPAAGMLLLQCLTGAAAYLLLAKLTKNENLTYLIQTGKELLRRATSKESD